MGKGTMRSVIKNTMLVLLLILIVALPLYAKKVQHFLKYQEVVLKTKNQTILVDRSTGLVVAWKRWVSSSTPDSIARTAGGWFSFTNEAEQQEYQKLYENEAEE